MTVDSRVSTGITKHFDVMLVDIGLPGMDGYEVARQMRALLADTKTTIVALTGYGRQEDRETALAAGFDQHLAKPIDTHVLEDLIAGVGRTEDESEPATLH